jgi:hypothetical protein
MKRDQHQLKANQLCGLLNYFLGLPVVSRRGHIMAPEIPVVGVGLWTLKVQARAERWVEDQMRREGMLPKLSKSRRGPRRQVVNELDKWLPAAAKSYLAAKGRTAA